MRRLMRAREERGATLVFVVICMVAILGATCLGVDTSSAVYQKGRLQHAADAAAFAIAKDCLETGADPCGPSGDEATVDEFIAANTNGGGAITSLSVDQDPESYVTVDITRAVDLFFGPAIGVATKDVTAHAKVIWEKHVVGGSVIPYAVSVCEFLKEKSGAGDGYLNTSINNNNAAPPGIGLIGQVDQGDPESVLNPFMDSCTAPEPYGYDVRTVRDGLWISDTAGAEYCNQKADVEVNSVHMARPLPTSCTAQQEANFEGVGSTILLAVYGPASPPVPDYMHGGACTVAAELDNDGCPLAVGGNPNFAITILGFAPFRVDGYCLGGPLGGANCSGDYVSSQRGFWGEFIATAEEFVDADYGSEGADLEAVKVELVE